MRNNWRQFFVYDLEVYTRKAGAVQPALKDLVTFWKREVDAGRASMNIRANTATLVLGDVSIDRRNQTATLLVKLSDTQAPNSVYSDPIAKTFVEHIKAGREGGEVGIHVLVSLAPERGFADRYTCVIERVPHLRVDSVHRILSHLIQEEFSGNPASFEYPHPGGQRDATGNVKMERARPYLRFEGRASAALQNDVNNGRLTGVTLIKTEAATPVGGSQFLKKNELALKLAIDHGHKPANVWAEIRRVLRADSTRFPAAELKFALPGRDKTVTVKVDTSTGAPLEDLYVRSFEITNLTPFLADSANSIVRHLERRAKVELLNERTI